jgi:FKBP-type peptidyl-prolyl cis-trans isomerase FkpA
VTADAAKTDTAKTEITKTDLESTATSGMKAEDKMGYALGAKMASFIRKDVTANQELNINNESIAKGFTDGLNATTILSEEEITQQFTLFQEKMQAEAAQKAAVHQAEQTAQDEAGKAAGDAFLVANGKKDGVKTTTSGLQYDVITSGAKDAAKPAATDVVKVHYTGTFIDGKVFDSSVERGEPISFPLNRVIAGWTEGLQLMSVGSKYHFVIPWKIAYGEAGRPGSIPKYSVLQFDVELIAINPEESKAKEEEKK